MSKIIGIASFHAVIPILNKSLTAIYKYKAAVNHLFGVFFL